MPAPARSCCLAWPTSTPTDRACGLLCLLHGAGIGATPGQTDWPHRRPDPTASVTSAVPARLHTPLLGCPGPRTPVAPYPGGPMPWRRDRTRPGGTNAPKLMRFIVSCPGADRRQVTGQAARDRQAFHRDQRNAARNRTNRSCAFRFLVQPVNHWGDRLPPGSDTQPPPVTRNR